MTKLHVLCMTYNQRPMAATSIHEATSWRCRETTNNPKHAHVIHEDADE